MLIQELRNRSHGIVAKVIVGMIVVVFALFGFGSITTFLVPVPKVASVNGDDIEEQEMLIAVERQRRIILANSQTRPEDIDDDQIRQTVLSDLIERKLLNQAADEFGLYLSDAKLDEDMLKTESFQIDGEFNADQFQLLIRSAGYTPLSYRELLRQESKSRQIAHGLASSEFVMPSEVDLVASLYQQLRNIAYLQLKVDDLKEDVNIDEQAVVDYYGAHASEFVNEERVDLEYVEIRKSDLADEVTYAESELRAYYDEETDNYVQPEERRAAHILIEVNDDVTDEQAKEKIDAIYQRITGGEDFATVAIETSEDTGSAESGGDLDYNAKGSFVEAFEDALYGLTLDQMTEPVRTEFGYHLIKLTGINEAVIPSFDELAEELDKDFRLLKAEELFVAKSSKLSELAYESPDLEGIASELELTVKTTGWVSHSTSEGLASNSQVLNVAFSEDLLKDGNNSDLIEVDPDYHVVVRVKDHKPSNVKEFSVVQEEIRELLVLDAARAQASLNMDEAVALLRTGSITRFVADEFGSQWVVLDGISRQQPNLDPKIVLEAYKLVRPAEGDKSVGGTILNNGDAVIVSVTAVIDKDASEVTEEEKKGLARMLASRKGGFAFGEFRYGLQENADIEKL
jgi:peptidyl-prolyl cis-trans isomerase D